MLVGLKETLAGLSIVQKIATIVASALVPVEGFIAASNLPPVTKAFALAEVAVAIALLAVLFGVNPVPPQA